MTKPKTKPKPMPDLRPATRSDLERAASWIRSSAEARLWAGRRISYPIEAESLAVALEFASASSFALDAAGTLRAFGQVVPKPGGRRHLARLIVDPSRRRSGLGRVMARGLVRAAREQDATRISLNVDAANLGALSLYHSLGFAEAERPPDEPITSSLYLETSA